MEIEIDLGFSSDLRNQNIENFGNKFPSSFFDNQITLFTFYIAPLIDLRLRFAPSPPLAIEIL
jgi:hypothetical protein